MSNKERIEALEYEVRDIRFGAEVLLGRVEWLEMQAKRMRPEVFFTPDWETTPEPSLPSPWQPMETCEDSSADNTLDHWVAYDGSNPAWPRSVQRRKWTTRKHDEDYGRIAWCSATNHPEAPPHPDVLGKVETSGPRPQWITNRPPTRADLPIYVKHLGGYWGFLPPFEVNEWCHLPVDRPLPAPPTKHAPEPSPDTKAERYTVDVFTIKEDGRFLVSCLRRGDPERIAAALNSTPDPLLVGLVDACRAWREKVTPLSIQQLPYLPERKVARGLVAALDAYLAEQGGEK